MELSHFGAEALWNNKFFATNDPAPVGAVGTLVSSLVDFPGGGGLDNVTDPDTGALLGVALTATNEIDGLWWYSTDNGANWSLVGARTDGTALLLNADANTRVYFQPTLNAFPLGGTVANGLTFRAWDRTSGANGGTADTTVNGGATPFSTATDTASITINGGEDYFGTALDDNHMGTAFDDLMHVSASAAFDTLNGAAHILGDELSFDTVINNGVTYTINTLSGVYDTAGGFGQTLASNFENLSGSSLDDVLTGDGNANVLQGKGGDDVLVATTGGDRLYGGANNAGGDTADFSGAGGVTVDLSDLGVQNVGGTIGNITLGGIENLTGSLVDADTFQGDANNNILLGGGGGDVLVGGQGDDTLDGGPSGDGTAVYLDGTQDGLVVNLTLGASSGGGLGNDQLYNIVNVTGSNFNDTLVGDSNDNTLSGGDGNDILFGGGVSGFFNLLSGGNDTDVALYSGRESDPSYTTVNLGQVVGGPDGANDFLTDVERLKFLAPSDVSDVDNNGKGNLIFQDNATGALTFRESLAGSIGPIAVGGTNWRVVGTGQFDPDAGRTADVLLQDNVTGDLKILTDIGGTPDLTAAIPTGQTVQWKAITTGDFNGDAASDVLLQNQVTGAARILFLNTDSADPIGTIDSTSAPLTNPGANWKVISSGDFNGDGKSDLLWQNSATKAVQVYLMDGATVTNAHTSQTATGLTAVGTGDFNGDGNSDILFKNASGQAVLWFMYGDLHIANKTVNKPGPAFNLSGAMDVDDNGYSDLIWRDGAGNTSATPMSGPSSLASTTAGPAFAMPSAANTFTLIASTGGG